MFKKTGFMLLGLLAMVSSFLSLKLGRKSKDGKRPLHFQVVRWFVT